MNGRLHELAARFFEHALAERYPSGWIVLTAPPLAELLELLRGLGLHEMADHLIEIELRIMDREEAPRRAH